MPSRDTRSADLQPGTLDKLILTAVSLRPLHGHGVLLRINQIAAAGWNRLSAAIEAALGTTADGV